MRMNIAVSPARAEVVVMNGADVQVSWFLQGLILPRCLFSSALGSRVLKSAKLKLHDLPRPTLEGDAAAIPMLASIFLKFDAFHLAASCNERECMARCWQPYGRCTLADP